MARNQSDLLPFLGCCCTIASLYYEYPSCVGCSGNFDCLILSSEWRCFKMKEGKGFFNISSGTCDVIEPKVLLKLQSQTFCIDSRCSLPPDGDVPCLVNLLFLTLAYQWKQNIKCFKKMGQL